MKLSKLLGAMGALAFLASTPVHADGYSWTGCYVGGHAGYGIVSHDTTIGATKGEYLLGALNVDGLSGDGGLVGVNAGCDLQLSGSPFVVGLFGDWSWRDLENSTSLDFPWESFSANTSFSVEDAWTLGGRVGWVVNDRTLLYALVGYTQANTSSLRVTVDGEGSAHLGGPDLTGWTIGGGLEAQLGSGWAIRGEYRYTRYDKESFSFPAELTDGLCFDPFLNIESTEQSGRIAVIYRFGGFGN